MYQPGLHIIASLQTDQADRLSEYPALMERLNQLIATHGLCKLGEVYHRFEQGGYTAVVCLSESHVSLHTWPEYGRVNLDIYLSNYQRANDDTCRAIYRALQQFFNGAVLAEQYITR
jgi:S-adenosylmethionine decarboxylase